MNIRQTLKKLPFLYNINTYIKARMQENLAQKELDYYRHEASRKGITVPESGPLVDILKARLAERGLNPVPKRKEDLHIFLAFSLNNWESILPLSLEPFGRVTVFEWKSRGHDDAAADWHLHREAMNRDMLGTFIRANAEKKVDAVMGYLWGHNTEPSVLRKMGESGAVVFNFCFDDKLYFHGPKLGGKHIGPGGLARAVDLNLTNAPEARVKYIVEGGLAMFWPEAAHPDIHKPYDLPREFDVSFVGKNYGWRSLFMKKLRKMGINAVCFGKGWENSPLSNEEMIKLYSRSRITLGFAGVGHSKKLMCLKGRDFEVPMSGGLYLTQNNPELSLVYKIGEEILTYSNENDCAEKIRTLLANPDRAEKIRTAGRKRSLKDHTWEKRFDEAFKLAGIMK